MNNQQDINILKEEKSWESDDRKIDAFNTAIHCMTFVSWLKKNHADVYSNMLDEMQMDR